MSLEDKHLNGVVVVSTPGMIEKKPKLSKEEKEAIFNRLTGGSSGSSSNVVFKRNATVSSDDSNIAGAGGAPVKRKPPPFRRSMSNTKDTADVEADNDVSPNGTGEVSASLLQKREGAAPIYRDFADWKRKNDVPPDAQVFCMTGWYPCVKQALLDRGWHMNPEPTSPYFDLKWSLRSCEVSLEVLKPEQLTNHFHKNGAITTKVGLLRSLSSLVWFADVCSNDIIPRGFDLTNPNETLTFMGKTRHTTTPDSKSKTHKCLYV